MDAAAAEELLARVAAQDVKLARLRAALLASETAGFLDRMRGTSSSHSGDTMSNTDVALRGAPEAGLADLEGLLAGLPEASAGAAAAAWAALRAAHAAQWAPPQPSATLSENKHVHPTIACVLRAALQPSSTPLQLWCNETAGHEAQLATIRPDFTFTHARDALPSTLGALLLVEVKLPGCIEDAVTQACIYLRRRVYRLCREAHARGEPMDAVFALGLAADGPHAVVLRMHSGAPPAGSGQSFAAAQPCPVQRSPLLPLLGA